MDVNVKIFLTPDQLAEMFIFWSDGEQGKFLDLVGQHFKDAEFDAELQCCYLADNITKAGRDFIYTVANFLKVRGICSGSPKESTLINTYPGDPL